MGKLNSNFQVLRKSDLVDVGTILLLHVSAFTHKHIEFNINNSPRVNKYCVRKLFKRAQQTPFTANLSD
jgi:hypothetical protein